MPGRPALSDLALVAAGGAGGTLLRAAIDLFVSAPLGTLLANTIGALLLGMLSEWLVLLGTQRRLSTAARTRLRLALGVGVLGGFTTYSMLANDTATLLLGGQLFAALGYALGTVLLGAAASALGIVLVRWAAGASAAASPQGKVTEP